MTIIHDSIKVKNTILRSKEIELRQPKAFLISIKLNVFHYHNKGVERSLNANRQCLSTGVKYGANLIS